MYMGYEGYEVGDDEYYLDALDDEALDNWRYRINETDDECRWKSCFIYHRSI